MYAQNKQTTGTLESPKGLGFFQHFPSNFLQPYGLAKPSPDSETIHRRINPKCCEWFRRPKIAMSEFGATMVENLEFLMKEQELPLINPSVVQDYTSSMTEFMEALKHVNTKNDLQPNAQHIRTILESMYQDNPEFNQLIDNMFQIGGAMFSTAIHFMVVKEIFTNPERFADKIAINDPPATTFKRQRDVKGLADFLTTNCTNEHSQRTSTATTAKRNLLAELKNYYEPPTEQQQTNPSTDNTTATMSSASTSTIPTIPIAIPITPSPNISTTDTPIQTPTAPTCTTTKNTKTTEPTGKKSKKETPPQQRKSKNKIAQIPPEEATETHTEETTVKQKKRKKVAPVQEVPAIVTYKKSKKSKKSKKEENDD